MRVINRPNVDKEDVRHMTDSELSELGVHVVNRTKLILGCNQCGEKCGAATRCERTAAVRVLGLPREM